MASSDEIENQKELNSLLERKNQLEESSKENTKKITSLLGSQAKALKSEVDDTEKIKQADDDILSSEKKQVETLKEKKGIIGTLKNMLSEMLKDTIDQTSKIYGNAGFQLKSINSLLGETLQINSELYKMTARLGVNNANNFNKVREAFTSATEGIGESLEQAKETVSSLINEGYIGNFNEATKTISMFARATGTSRTELASTFSELNKSMRMSESSISSVYASMVKIQQVNGLTQKGMNAVSASIKTMATNMKAFGSTEGNVKTMAVGMTRLASEMEKVGLSAQKAAEMVERLTDPDKIEENIGLYAQLGMSVSDALSGNFDDSQMNAGLAEFGSRIKEMGPIAGKEFAKAFGVSYKDAVKMADMQAIGQELVPEKDSFEVLKESLEATQDSTEKLAVAMNKIVGMLFGMGPVFLGVVAVVKNGLGKFFGSIKKAINDVKNSFKEALTPPAQKANNIVDGLIFDPKKIIKLSKHKAGTKKELDRLGKEMLKELEGKSGEAAQVILKKYEKNLRELRKRYEDGKKEIINTNGGATEKKGIFGRIKGAVTGARERVVGGFKASVARNGGGFKGGVKTVVKGGAKAVVKGGAGILGGAAKFLGPISMVLGLLAPLLTDVIKNNKEFMDKINKVIGKFKEKLQPVIEKLMKALEPIVEMMLDLIEPLTDVIMVIVDIFIDTFMPILKTIIQAIGPVLKLIGTMLKLLAPIIKLLSYPLMLIAKAIGPIASLLDWVLTKLLGAFSWLFGSKKEEQETTEANTNALNANTEATKEQEREHVRTTADGRVVATTAKINDNSATITQNDVSNDEACKSKSCSKSNK